MSHSNPSITVNVDVTNPGQFFACCGLFELADRLWPGAEGWFEEHSFCIAGDGNIEELIEAITDVELYQTDTDDKTESPICIPTPFHLRLDWWKDERAGGEKLKIWIGRMNSFGIAYAMQKAIVCPNEPGRLFDQSTVVYKEDNKEKIEPYYFDSRRGSNAHSLDIGFSPDKLWEKKVQSEFKMTTAAYPAVEFFCLVGLQRFRPDTKKQNRAVQYQYCVWPESLPLKIASAVGNGLLPLSDSSLFRFEIGVRGKPPFRYKHFLPATQIGD